MATEENMQAFAAALKAIIPNSDDNIKVTSDGIQFFLPAIAQQAVMEALRENLSVNDHQTLLITENDLPPAALLEQIMPVLRDSYQAYEKALSEKKSLPMGRSYEAQSPIIKATVDALIAAERSHGNREVAGSITQMTQLIDKLNALDSKHQAEADNYLAIKKILHKAKKQPTNDSAEIVAGLVSRVQKSDTFKSAATLAKASPAETALEPSPSRDSAGSVGSEPKSVGSTPPASPKESRRPPASQCSQDVVPYTLW